MDMDKIREGDAERHRLDRVCDLTNKADKPMVYVTPTRQICACHVRTDCLLHGFAGRSIVDVNALQGEMESWRILADSTNKDRDALRLRLDAAMKVVEAARHSCRADLKVGDMNDRVWGDITVTCFDEDYVALIKAIRAFDSTPGAGESKEGAGYGS